jgi:hypothetical protein
MTRVVEPDRPSLSTAMTRRCGSETANPNAPEDLAEKRIVGRLVMPPRVPARGRSTSLRHRLYVADGLKSFA